jgi:hypothetical protein
LPKKERIFERSNVGWRSLSLIHVNAIAAFAVRPLMEKPNLAAWQFNANCVNRVRTNELITDAAQNSVMNHRLLPPIYRWQSIEISATTASIQFSIFDLEGSAVDNGPQYSGVSPEPNTLRGKWAAAKEKVMLKSKRVSFWVMMAGLALVFLCYPTLFILPQHPVRSFSELNWSASIYFGVFLVGTILFWKGSLAWTRRRLEVPIIYAHKDRGVIGACSQIDYEMGMSETHRVRQVLGQQKQRPEPALMALFADDPIESVNLGNLRTGSLTDWEFLSEDCEIRWVEMHVPHYPRYGQPPIDLGAARKLLRGNFPYTTALTIQRADRELKIAVALAALLFALAVGYNAYHFFG